MSENENLLEYDHVTVTKKGFCIEDASFAVKKGYITVLTGDNGAGKSTLLSMLMGKANKYSGTIRLNGKDIRENREYYLNHAGIISEEPFYFMEMDAYENAEFLGRFYEKWEEELFRELLGRLSISPRTPVGKLSRGNHIKFQFAFAMAHHPSLYVMDEPTAGLDPVWRCTFFQMLQELVTEETAVFMSTNIWSDVAQIADYQLEIANGKIMGMEEAS